MSNKKSFILYLDQQELFNKLPDDVAGKLIKHIFSYVNCENPTTDDLLLDIAFEPIRQALKRDLKTWEKQLNQRSEAGKKSAAARANKAQRKPTKSTSVESRSTKSTDSVSDSVNVSDKDIKDKDILSPSPKADPVPYQKIIDLYHKILPDLPTVAKLTPKRKSQIRQRHKEDLNELTNWENFFDYVSQSDFLMGKVQPRDGRTVFRADIEWLTNSTNFTKIAEDKYHV